MGRPKGDIETETIGTRLPVDVIEDLKKCAEERGTNRSDIVARAIKEYLNAIECINCGTLNSGSMGVYCSHCSQRLFTDDNITWVVSQVIPALLDSKKTNGDTTPELIKKIGNEIQSLIKEFDKYKKLGLTPQAEFIIDRKGEGTKYKLRFHFVADGGVDVVPTEYRNTVDLDKAFVLSACNSFVEAYEEQMAQREAGMTAAEARIKQIMIDDMKKEKKNK